MAPPGELGFSRQGREINTNTGLIDWIRIATEIELNYTQFDAFVILHGTDTMAYTASALSFLLEDLGKTVILTGAQIPLSQLRNDATDNLMGALSIAGHYIIPGKQCSPQRSVQPTKKSQNVACISITLSSEATE